MIEENLKTLSRKSKEYYKSITSIDVTPLKKRDLSNYLVYKKGDTIVKKRLFRKPKVTTAVEDLYKIDGSSLITADEVVKHHFWSTRYNKEGNFFYYPGEVDVHFGKNKEYYKFDTNEDLKTFVTDLTDKCRKCGNELL